MKKIKKFEVGDLVLIFPKHDCKIWELIEILKTTDIGFLCCKRSTSHLFMYQAKYLEYYEPFLDTYKCKIIGKI